MKQPQLRDGFELSATRHTLPMALLRLREVVMAEFRPILTTHGVTEQQWRVLRVLMEVDEIAAGDLADRALILAPSLSRILKVLETREFLTIHRNPGDGRRVRISLTGQGKEFIQSVAPASAQAYASIEARIGRERIEDLLAILDEATCLLEDESTPGRSGT